MSHTGVIQNEMRIRMFEEELLWILVTPASTRCRDVQYYYDWNRHLSATTGSRILRHLSATTGVAISVKQDTILQNRIISPLRLVIKSC